MRIAITGTTGRVGRALADRLALRHEVIELPHRSLDLAAPGCAGALADLDFDLLLNPAGMTGLEHCEDEPALARQVNAAAPGDLARACRLAGRKMLHFSTDYVFDGRTPGLRREEEATAPLSVYGTTKEEGERRVLEDGGTVMRVSWVFGPEKPAFPDSIFDAALEGRPLAAVADKFSLPAYTPDICAWVEALVAAGLPPGVFHACNGGEVTSWHGIALEVVRFLQERADLPPAEVEPLSMEGMAAFRAPRPRHTAMATEKLAALPGGTPRDWREALREHLESRLISR